MAEQLPNALRLMPLDEALARLLACRHAAARAPRSVSTFEADGRVLAQDVVSALTVPPRDNSSMDGYAVRSADCAAPGAVLRVASASRPAPWARRWPPARPRASSPARRSPKAPTRS